MSCALPFFELEKLDEELVPFLEDCDLSFPMIRHPLVYSIMHSPALNRLVNQQLRAKKERIAMLEAAENYESIIPLYERPYRLHAVLKYADRLTDEQYWKTLGWVWTDTENFWQNSEEWVGALTAERPESNCMMGEKDRAFFDALPEEFTIYRGQEEMYDTGWAWTTDVEKAKWFANRFGRNGVVYVATVWKAAILACFVGRGESEVVVNPEFVRLTWTRSFLDE